MKTNRNKTRNQTDNGISLSKLLKPVAIVASACIAVNGAVGAMNGYFDFKDKMAIRGNLCLPSESVANDTSSYRRWASEAIKESKDLGRKVGVDRLGEILYEKNDGRDIVPGESYQTITCKHY